MPDAASDRLHILRREGARLLPHRIAPQRPGSGPIQAVFHPLIPVLYTCNAGNSTVTAHRWDSALALPRFAQSIRTIPAAFAGGNRTIGITISADGRYLYAVNHGHDSIAVFAIQRGKGKLFLRAREMLPRPPPGPPVLDAAGTMMLLGNPHDTPLRLGVQPANGMLARLD